MQETFNQHEYLPWTECVDLKVTYYGLVLKEKKDEPLFIVGLA